MKSKEKILSSALSLASERGLGKVSLSMIAERAGISKATLYSHFKSKDDIIKSLYEYLRSKARGRDGAPIDYEIFVRGKSAEEALLEAVTNYQSMNSQKGLFEFYTLIYSERAHSPAAAMIVLEEKERMLKQSRALLDALKNNGLLSFQDKGIETASIMFCYTIHELMDIENDRKQNNLSDGGKGIREFISGFCYLYA